MSEYVDCDDCAYHGDYNQDAEYICADCESDICFDHMKVWPQPKEYKPIHYCKQCYQHRWEMMNQ